MHASGAFAPITTLHRARLEASVSAALETAPLVVLQAPLGSGKSTLLASIARSRPQTAEFQVGPWHKGHFVEELVAGIRAVRPGFGRRFMGARDEPEGARLGELFLRDLQHVPSSITLAIDNLENLSDDTQFASFLHHLALHAPDDLRIIAAGRSLPPINLATLLVRGRAIELSSDILAFTPEEIEALLALNKRAASEAVVQTLASETAGWAASLSLALSYASDSAAFATRDLAMRFFEETLAPALAPQDRLFLGLLSVYEAIDPERLAKVEEYGDIVEGLERLRRSGAPLVLKDRHYVMHPLLRDFGTRYLHAADKLGEAHALAAQTFSSAGNLSAALYHVARSDDEAAIDAFFRRHGESAMRTGNHEAIRSALARLSRPESDDIAAYVGALIAKDTASPDVDRLLLKASQSTDDAVAFSARAAQVERSIGREGRVEPGALENLRAHSAALGPQAQARVAVLQGWSYAVDGHFAKALEAIEPIRGIDDSGIQFNYGILFAYAQTALGFGDAALSELDALVRRFENDDRIVFQTLSLVWQARLALLLNRVNIAGESARAALRFIDALPLGSEQAALYLALAEIATHEGSASDALRFAERSARSSSRAWYRADEIRAKYFSELIVARAAFLSEDVGTARDLAQRLSEKTEAPLPLRAKAAAESAFYQAFMAGEATPNVAHELLLEAKPADAFDAVLIDTAASLLKFLSILSDKPIAGSAIDSLAPYACLLEARGGTTAIDHLGTAIRNVRLGQATSDAVESALAGFGEGHASFELRLLQKFASRVTPVRTPQRALENFDLTAREHEILELLVEGLSNKEIAQRLILSSRTVETHVERVLGKLEVGSRSRAIAKALRLGLVVLENEA